jgi:hypothetical protein
MFCPSTPEPSGRRKTILYSFAFKNFGGDKQMGGPDSKLIHNPHPYFLKTWKAGCEAAIAQSV